MKIQVEKIRTFDGHKDCIYSLAQFSNSANFFSAGADGIVAQWNAEETKDGKLVSKTKNSIYSLCLLEKHNQLIIGENNDGLHLIDLTENKRIKSLHLTSKLIFDIKHIGNTVFVATEEGVLFVIDLNSFTILKKIQLSNLSLRCISIGEKILAVGSSDHHIYILNAETLEIQQKINAHTNSVFSICFSPNKKILLSGSRDAHLKVWNTENFELEHDIVAHLYTINDICFNSEGNYFVTCSKDKSIKVWDAIEFKLLKVIDKSRHAGHGTSVNKLLWNSVTNHILSASDDRSVSVWNLRID